MAATSAEVEFDDALWPVVHRARQLALAILGLDAHLKNYGLDRDMIAARVTALAALADELDAELSQLEVAQAARRRERDGEAERLRIIRPDVRPPIEGSERPGQEGA